MREGGETSRWRRTNQNIVLLLSKVVARPEREQNSEHFPPGVLQKQKCGCGNRSTRAISRTDIVENVLHDLAAAMTAIFEEERGAE